MAALSYVYFVDFDGTITQQDVCAKIVTRLAGDGWRSINEQWERGELSTVECARQTLRTFRCRDPASILEIAETMRLEKGFREFVDWARAREESIFIVSDGYDLYIDALLQREGISLPVYANRLLFADGSIDIQAPYQSNDCGRCGVCKTSLVRSLASPDLISVYIGDGVSDYCPARVCDRVFARRQLADYCRNHGIDADPFRDFFDIIRRLEENPK